MDHHFQGLIRASLSRHSILTAPTSNAHLGTPRVMPDIQPQFSILGAHAWVGSDLKSIPSEEPLVESVCQ